MAIAGLAAAVMFDFYGTDQRIGGGLVADRDAEDAAYGGERVAVELAYSELNNLYKPHCAIRTSDKRDFKAAAQVHAGHVAVKVKPPQIFIVAMLFAFR